MGTRLGQDDTFFDDIVCDRVFVLTCPSHQAVESALEEIAGEDAQDAWRAITLLDKLQSEFGYRARPQTIADWTKAARLTALSDFADSAEARRRVEAMAKRLRPERAPPSMYSAGRPRRPKGAKRPKIHRRPPPVAGESKA